MNALTTATIIESVTFKAKPKVSDEALIEAALKTDVVLDNIEGFIHRYIAKQDNQTWLEVVFWQQKTLAEQGLQLFLQADESKAFLDLIESRSVKIEYAEIMNQ